MQVETEKKRSGEGTGRAGPWLAVSAIVIAAALCLLLGAQLAFLVGLPHLPVFARDPQAMWLVFSTWPQMRFGLFSFLLVAVYQIMSGMVQGKIGVADTFGRVRNMSRPAVVATIGVSVFLLIFVLAMPGIVLFELATVLFCAVIGCLIFMWASRAGVPLPALWMIAALSIGFFGNLLMSDADHRSFTCRAGVVQLRSGEALPCQNLVWLSGKPLWLVEGPQDPRLILRDDIGDEEVEQALGL